MSKRVKKIMRDNNDKHEECELTLTDSEGNTNLCCCYIMDEDGRIEDPCYLPAEKCCSY